mmetsp:Transcript_54828/g.169006  ORF Transcript_54828/g.169006 Transcript_54828/m.169006 type:complete len:219 (-) Transcript_54828:66-722(-)
MSSCRGGDSAIGSDSSASNPASLGCAVDAPPRVATSLDTSLPETRSCLRRHARLTRPTSTGFTMPKWSSRSDTVSHESMMSSSSVSLPVTARTSADHGSACLAAAELPGFTVVAGLAGGATTPPRSGVEAPKENDPLGLGTATVGAVDAKTTGPLPGVQRGGDTTRDMRLPSSAIAKPSRVSASAWRPLPFAPDLSRAPDLGVPFGLAVSRSGLRLTA